MSMIVYAEFDTIEQAEHAAGVIRHAVREVQSVDLYQSRAARRRLEQEDRPISFVPINGLTTSYYAGDLYPLFYTWNTSYEGPPFDAFPIAEEEATDVGETAEREHAVLILEAAEAARPRIEQLCLSLGGHILRPSNEQRK